MTRVNSRSELAGSKSALAANRRGLGHAEPLGGARHAALTQQLAQRHKQVQVEIGQVSDGTRHGATI